MADVKMAQIINPLSVSFVYFFSNAAETLSIRLSRRSDVLF